jgi:hypothetical protein
MPVPVRAENSNRLQRVLSVLSDGQEHSTRDIADGANVVAVDTAIRELRGWPNNLPIHGFRRGHVHFYRLEPVARLQMLVQQAARLADELLTTP